MYIYIYIYHYRPRFHAWELSKQASKQTFVCRRRICTKGSPCFTRVSFPSFRSVLFSSPLFHVDRRRFARRSDPRAISTPVSWLFPFVFRLFTFLNFISIFPLSSIWIFFFFFFFVVIIGLEGEKHERIRGHPMYDPRGEIVSVLSIRSMLGIWSELSELEKSICNMSTKLQWRGRHSRWKEITSRLFNMYPFFMFSAQHRLQIISHHSRLLPCSSKFYAPNGAPVTFRNVRVRCSRKRFLGRRRTDSKTQNGREIRFVNIVSCFTIVNNNNE